MEKTEDILEIIADHDLPMLAKMYEGHREWAPNVYSAITTAIDWRNKGMGNIMTVTSPNGCWREDGTFFLTVQCVRFHIYIFTLDKKCINVYKGLTETRRFEGVKENLFFFCIHEFLYSTIRRAVEEKNLITQNYPLCEYMFVLPREEALRNTISCPSDVYIKKLDKQHSAVVNDQWPHKSQGSEKFVSLLIEMNDTYGVFVRSNNELVSWVLLSIMGQLAILQTKENYRNRGYANLLTRYMSKILAERGHNAFAAVLLHNSASIRMFEKLNFKIIGYASYILVE